MYCPVWSPVSSLKTSRFPVRHKVTLSAWPYRTGSDHEDCRLQSVKYEDVIYVHQCTSVDLSACTYIDDVLSSV